MDSSAEANTLLEMTKLILPVVTFLLGFGLSQLDKFRESKRRLRNLKSILFKELRENYKSLSQVQREKSGAAPPPPHLTGLMMERLSTTVYENYLDRIDSLKPTELDKVFDAYAMMQNTIASAKEFLTAARTQPVTDEEKKFTAQRRRLS